MQPETRLPVAMGTESYDVTTVRVGVLGFTLPFPQDPLPWAEAGEKTKKAPSFPLASLSRRVQEVDGCPSSCPHWYTCVHAWVHSRPELRACAAHILPLRTSLELCPALISEKVK